MSGSQNQYDVVYIGQPLEDDSLNFTSIEPENLAGCRGEIGDFTLKLTAGGEEAENKLSAASIVINLPYREELPLEEADSLSGDLSHLLEDGSEKPLIIIQDYPDLSPAAVSKWGLEAALKARENSEQRDIYYFYKAMRFMEENDELYERARSQEVIFLKHDLGELSIDQNGVEYKREDIELELEGDLVIAPRLRPAQGTEELAKKLNIEQDEKGYLQKKNVYLQPTLSGKRGVYVLAGARGPNALTYQEEEISYTLTELKRNLRGVEEIDDEEREIDDQKCIVCYTCQRVCPHGAVQRDDELNSMTIMDKACQGCNLCISRCPAGAITRSGEEERELSAGTQVIICENSASIARDKAESDPLQGLEVEEVPCVSTVKRENIFSRLAAGESEVLVLGCISEACKHLTGHDRCEQVIEKAKEDMQKLDLDDSRLQYHRLSPRMAQDLSTFLQEWKGEVST